MESVDYLRLLRRRWSLLTACVLVAGVVALLSTPAEPADDRVTYEAEHVLLRDSAAATPPPSLAQLALFVETGAVPERVAARLADGSTAGAVTDRIEAEPDEPSGSLTIVATAPTRAGAAELANAFGDEVLAYIGEQAQAEQDVRIDAANEDVLRLQGEIDELEVQIQTARDAGAPTAVLEAQRDAKIREFALALDSQTRVLDEPPPEAGYATLAEATAEGASPADGGFETPRGFAARLGLALAAGLALGVVAVLVAERLDPRINTRDGAQAAFALPVVAEIPRVRRRGRNPGRSIAFQDDPISAAAEAHRSLRAAILLTPISQLGTRRDGSSSEPRVILVTSPTPGEGKTTTVANLAAAFAETGRSVLVLSCDFRRPELHTYFGVPPTPGLSDVFTGVHRLSAIVRPTPIDGVTIAPDGGGLRHLGDLAAAGHEVIAEASLLADVVLIDTPPLLATNDASELIAAVDAVVVICRSGGTTAEAARRTRFLLERLSTPVVGVVLVGVHETEPSYADYYTTRAVAAGNGALPDPGASPIERRVEKAPKMGATSATSLLVRSPAVLSRRLADRVLVLQGDDELLTLEGGAVAVWDELAEPITAGEITRRLAERHGADVAEVAKGVREVVERLVSGGAVEIQA